MFCCMPPRMLQFRECTSVPSALGCADLHPYADNALISGRTGETKMSILWIRRQKQWEKISTRLRRKKKRKKRKRKKKRKKTLDLWQILLRRCALKCNFAFCSRAGARPH